MPLLNRLVKSAWLPWAILDTITPPVIACWSLRPFSITAARSFSFFRARSAWSSSCCFSNAVSCRGDNHSSSQINRLHLLNASKPMPPLCATTFFSNTASYTMSGRNVLRCKDNNEGVAMMVANAGNCTNSARMSWPQNQKHRKKVSLDPSLYSNLKDVCS